MSYLYQNFREVDMIIGKISKGEKTVKFFVKINCIDCKKTVSGKILASEKYSKTESFTKELEKFKKDYLCGICRDRRRVHKEC